MADTHTHLVEDHDPTVHHEDSDINVRGVLWFAAIFVVVAVVLHVAMYYLLVGFRLYENNRQTTPITEVTVEPERQFPPEPRLQPFPHPVGSLEDAATLAREKQESAQVPGKFSNPWEETPAADWKEYKAAYDERLNSYGWVDQRNGIVHIPIEEAKDRLLRRGLPSRPALPVTTTESATDMRPLPGAGAPVPVEAAADTSTAATEASTPSATTTTAAPPAQAPATAGEPNR